MLGIFVSESIQRPPPKRKSFNASNRAEPTNTSKHPALNLKWEMGSFHPWILYCRCLAFIPWFSGNSWQRIHCSVNLAKWTLNKWAAGECFQKLYFRKIIVSTRKNRTPSRVIAMYMNDAMFCFFNSLKPKLIVLSKKLHCEEEHLTGLKAPRS